MSEKWPDPRWSARREQILKRTLDDVYGIRVSGIGACATSILAHLGSITPDQYRRLGLVYNTLLKLQEEIAFGK